MIRTAQMAILAARPKPYVWGTLRNAILWSAENNVAVTAKGTGHSTTNDNNATAVGSHKPAQAYNA